MSAYSGSRASWSRGSSSSSCASSSSASSASCSSPTRPSGRRSWLASWGPWPTLPSTPASCPPRRPPAPGSWSSGRYSPDSPSSPPTFSSSSCLTGTRSGRGTLRTRSSRCPTTSEYYLLSREQQSMELLQPNRKTWWVTRCWEYCVVKQSVRVFF